MKKIFIVVLSFIFGLIISCQLLTDNNESECPGNKRPMTNESSVTIGQGIWGDIWFWEGDFMPVCPQGNVAPVEREIRIHTLTHKDQVDCKNSSFFYSISTQLIATTWSNEKGFFEAELDTGWYSIFVLEDSLFYANGGDGQGNIWPVHVSKGIATGIIFNIDYLSSH